MKIELRLTDTELGAFKPALSHYFGGTRLDTSIEHFGVCAALALIDAYKAESDPVLYLEGRE